MAYADYEHCPGCDAKVIYMGGRDAMDSDELGIVVCWHQVCLDAEIARCAASERERIYDLFGRDHFVVFTEDRWTVEHSVECRLSGHMHECRHHAAVARIAAEFDPDMAGRWLITAIDLNGEPALVRADLLTGEKP